MDTENELLTVEEAAKFLTISKPTLWRILRRGELPVVKIGLKGTRVKRQDIEIYIGERHYKRKSVKDSEAKG